jgi:hypothetical protein
MVQYTRNAWERYAQRLRHWLRPIEAGYKKIFSIEEIENQPVVQWMFGASLFYFFVSYSWWISRDTATLETAQSGGAICWPYFQDCAHLYFLSAFPYGYTQSAFYMLLYTVMCLIVYCMWKREWVYAHLLLALLLIWKLFVIFLVSFLQAGPYDYYHIVLTSVLLFAAHKEFFLKLSFVFMYFMSVTVKFTDGWILGTYFSSMRSGLPLFPEWSTIFLTNFVIFIQIIDSWFLMSRNWFLQKISFVIAAAFHIYSGVLVGYNYPSVALPAVLILFGPMYRFTRTPFTRKAAVGWVIIGLLALFQLLGFVVSPNRFMTLEGHRYGMFMFEANHQCLGTLKTYRSEPAARAFWSGLDCSGLYCTTETSVQTENGQTVRTRKFESAAAWNRCDPYEIWARAKSACTDAGVERIALQFDHSINGGPFYRIVDEANICVLEYKPFSHNSWIKVPPEAPLVGYPVQNFYSL